MPASPSELLRALAVLCEAPASQHLRLGELLELPGAADPAAHTRLFLLELYPHASVYVGTEGMLGGEARDRVAGFWRAVGRRPPPEPDHLAALLGLYATLAEEGEQDPAGPGADAGDEEARSILRHRARKALLWEHLLVWLGPWLSKAIEIAPAFYRAWAELLLETLCGEAGRLGPPEKLPLHLLEAPPLTDPRREEVEASGEAFLGSLVAPVRSGFLLTRGDFERAGHELGLAVRAGERRYALRGLLQQEPRETLEWLRREASAWARRHDGGWGRATAREAEAIAPVAAWWSERAGRSAELLGSLAAGAAPLEPAAPFREVPATPP